MGLRPSKVTGYVQQVTLFGPKSASKHTFITCLRVTTPADGCAALTCGNTNETPHIGEVTLSQHCGLSARDLSL
jgi:hypothetical protein